MPSIIHAWYSQKQFNNLNNFRDSGEPYIYYRNREGKIVQVTEVSPISSQYPSNFDDAVYLGVVTPFYQRSETPIKIEQ